jgi:hypothetical protein
MPQIQFVGRILPMIFQISVLSSRDVLWKDLSGGSGLEATFKIRIANSKIVVDTTTNRFDPGDQHTLYNQAYSLARASVNLVAFGSGVGPIVVFDTIIDPNGFPLTIQPEDRSLSRFCTAFDSTPERAADFNQIYDLVIAGPTVFKCLNDLIECFWSPHVTCLNCGRIVDAVCRIITPSTKGPNAAAWAKMRNVLNISKTYLQRISDNAIGPRHGADASHIPFNVSTDMIHRTWQILNRFFEYQKHNAPLTSAVPFLTEYRNPEMFPLLQEMP